MEKSKGFDRGVAKSEFPDGKKKKKHLTSQSRCRPDRPDLKSPRIPGIMSLALAPDTFATFGVSLHN